MGENPSAELPQLGHQSKVAQRPFNFKTGMSQGPELDRQEEGDSTLDLG